MILGAVVALGVLGAAPAAAPSSSSAAAKPIVKINARIRTQTTGGSGIPVFLTFTPNVVNVGKVRIVVRNNDPFVPHQISINGISSQWMGPGGGTTVVTVTFKRPGKYSAGTFGGMEPDGGEFGGTGTLKVVK